MDIFFDRNKKASDRHKQSNIEEIEKELEKRYGLGFPSNWKNYLILEWKDWRDKIMKCEYEAEIWIYQSFLREIKDWISRHCNNPQYFKQEYLEKIQKDLAEYKISLNKLKYANEETYFPNDPKPLSLAKSKKFSIKRFYR